jgi:hypothetical protein
MRIRSGRTRLVPLRKQAFGAPRAAPTGFWTLMGLAAMTGFAAITVGSTLQTPPDAGDNRILFVIGAGLTALLLVLAAEAWRFLAVEREP